ncbi:MAG: pilus assembly protein PilM [Deltaproteobacteria bacterium]|nr:pilus assembly protein PilM [Deltaproteobacteria bacterium]
MFQKTAYSAIGIDITSHGAKALQFKRHNGFLSLHHASQLSFRDLDEGEMEEALPKLLAADQFKGKKVMLSLPSPLITTIPIKVSKKENESIDQAVLREAGNYLPFSLEGAIIDYLSTPIIDQKQNFVLLIAAKRADILRHIDMVKKAGLEAAVIEPRYCSLFRTIQKALKKIFHDQFFIYLEEDATIIMAVVDGQILFVREVSWGISRVREKMERTLGLSPKRAQKVLQQYGLEGENSDNQKGRKVGHLEVKELHQVIHEVINPILEELCHEIQKVLSYCSSIIQQRRPIDRALLLGQGVNIKSLAHFIQQNLGINVMTWDSMEKREIIKEERPFFEIPLGLTLRDEQCLE